MYDIGKHVSIVVNGNEGIVAVSDIYKLVSIVVNGNEGIVTVYDIGKHVSIVVNEWIVTVSDIYKRGFNDG